MGSAGSVEELPELLNLRRSAAAGHGPPEEVGGLAADDLPTFSAECLVLRVPPAVRWSSHFPTHARRASSPQAPEPSSG